MPNITSIFLGLIGGVVGIALIAHGIDRTKAAFRIFTTPTTNTTNLSDGKVEIKGEIDRAVDDRIETPFERETAVVANWKVEDWDERGDNSHWIEQESGVVAAPFHVSDESGEVVVDFGGDGIEKTGWGEDPDAEVFETTEDTVRCVISSDEEEVYVDVDDEPPAHLTDFVEAHEGIDEQSGSILNAINAGKKDGDRRYLEETLEVGDEVYVLGEYDSQDRVVCAPEDWPLLISDKEEWKLLGWRTVVGITSILLGVPATLLGVLFLFAGVTA